MVCRSSARNCDYLEHLLEDVMHRLSGPFVLIFLATATLSNALAQGTETTPNRDTDIAAIRATASEYATAASSGNVDVMRRMWTPEADYIDASGQRSKARELLRREAASPSKVGTRSATAWSQAPSSTLRLVTPDVAIEDGAVDIGVSHDGGALTGRFTAVWVKRDGRWLLDSLREAISQTATANDQLQSLSWLLGEWAGVVGDQAILVSADWSDAGSYIVRKFVVHGGGNQVVTGTERIGWDPVSGEIVSWTFDSQGGHSESRWKRDGEQWSVESTKVMSDGKKATSTSVYTPGDGTAFSWAVSRANVADERMPPVRIEFKRAAEEE
jgi:ketosteroid isomerase-like protein